MALVYVAYGKSDPFSYLLLLPVAYPFENFQRRFMNLRQFQQ
jgi:hypothetical protein